MEIPFSLEEVVVENMRSGVLVHFEPVPKSPSAMTDQELSSLGIKGLIAAIKNKGGKPGLARSSKPKLIEKLKSLFKK